jgi:hypothetical protein
MEHESGEWELKVLSVSLNDPPITYTVKFYGAVNGHTIDLSFELPTTIGLWKTGHALRSMLNTGSFLAHTQL